MEWNNKWDCNRTKSKIKKDRSVESWLFYCSQTIILNLEEVEILEEIVEELLSDFDFKLSPKSIHIFAKEEISVSKLRDEKNEDEIYNELKDRAFSSTKNAFQLLSDYIDKKKNT